MGRLSNAKEGGLRGLWWTTIDSFVALYGSRSTRSTLLSDVTRRRPKRSVATFSTHDPLGKWCRRRDVSVGVVALTTAFAAGEQRARLEPNMFVSRRYTVTRHVGVAVNRIPQRSSNTRVPGVSICGRAAVGTPENPSGEGRYHAQLRILVFDICESSRIIPKDFRIGVVNLEDLPERHKAANRNISLQITAIYFTWGSVRNLYAHHESGGKLRLAAFK